jgi:hypothetical protein
MTAAPRRTVDGRSTSSCRHTPMPIRSAVRSRLSLADAYTLVLHVVTGATMPLRRPCWRATIGACAFTASQGAWLATPTATASSPTRGRFIAYAATTTLVSTISSSPCARGARHAGAGGVAPTTSCSPTRSIHTRLRLAPSPGPDRDAGNWFIVGHHRPSPPRFDASAVGTSGWLAGTASSSIMAAPPPRVDVPSVALLRPALGTPLPLVR